LVQSAIPDSAGIAAKLELHSLRAQENYADQLRTQLTATRPTWGVEIENGTGSYGGGSLPDQTIPAKLVVIKPEGLGVEALDAQLRKGDPAVVGYLRGGAYVLNMLSLLPGDAEQIAARLGEGTDG
jgi:L-seryl-tRNA(Ser) seleniumtransferase